MTFEETERRVIAFVAQQMLDGACPQCLAKALVGVAIDSAFDHGIAENMHALLRRCVVALDQCQFDHPNKPARSH